VIIPIRCFSCGKVVGSSYETYKKNVEMGEDPKEVLDRLGVKRYCCRRMILAHADLIDDVMPYD
jgi:DNA-directed RNA polymerase subunit N